MMAARAEQLVAGRDLDEDRDIPSRRDRHPDQRHAQPEDLVVVVVESQALVFAGRVPPLEMHNQLDPLG